MSAATYGFGQRGCYNAVKRSIASIPEAAMATLTVWNLDDALVRQLRVRVAEHGRSAEAEHREILRMALTGAPATRQEAADRLAAFRQRTAGRSGPTASDLLAEARAERLHSLAGPDT